MATINVTTWDQFITAFSRAVPSGDTEDIIEIMADIDINNSPMTGSISAGGTKIINGNYHTITNLSTSEVVNSNLISSGGNRTITWNKLNFTNLYRNENYSFFAGATYYHMIFNDCTFQGKGFRLGVNCDFNRSAVTWEFTRPTGGVFGGCNFTTSWLHIDVKRDNGVEEYIFDSLTSSYCEGSVKGTGDNYNGWFFMGSVNNSVINLDCDLNYSYGLCSGSITNVSVYNTTKMTGTISAQTNLTGVSDSDMHSAAALAAVGFNIIV